MVGFNHRFHPAFYRQKEIFDKGEIGEAMFINSRYGLVVGKTIIKNGFNKK